MRQHLRYPAIVSKCISAWLDSTYLPRPEGHHVGSGRSQPGVGARFLPLRPPKRCSCVDHFQLRDVSGCRIASRGDPGGNDVTCGNFPRGSSERN